MEFHRDVMRKRRYEMGLSQSDIAEKLKTCVANICRIETGITKKPRWYTIVRLADVLELNSSDLYF